jgi:hypothetical protein
MFTGLVGNLSSGDGATLGHSGSNWTLPVRPAPGQDLSAVACFPVSSYVTPVLFEPGTVTTPVTENEDPSQEVCGFWQTGNVEGTSASMTMSDQGTTPDPYPLGGATWTLNEVDFGANAECAWTPYSTSWNWHVTGGTATKTVPVGTTCSLSSLSGNLTENNFTQGAWATVNFGTGAWTFTVASGVDAWYLCID